MPTNAAFPSPDGPGGPARARDRFEDVFERFLWKLRLIAILPVIMSLASTGVTFVLGTLEIGKAILGLGHAVDTVEKGYMAKLLISPIEHARQGSSRMRSGLLEISSLDQLKEKLVKVLVVALIVSAFKAMLTLPINDGPTLALFCLAVLLLALSGYLVASDRGHHPSA